MVARLDATDVHENRAAERLAAALAPDPAGQNIRIGRAAYGTVFLFATTRGVLVPDERAIARLNAVDPILTLATLKPFARVGSGTMIASIKTIAYGAPEAKVARAEGLASGALRVAPVTIRTASFIETVLAAEPRANPKGLRAVAHRLAALGIDLIETRRVPHDTKALTSAIREAKGEMVLVLTASATSDRNDVAPLALRKAGGKLTRYGMPVDPGHLLFYGALDARPVIGLPGCARSLVPNGVDYVIERLACGLTISASQFAAFGIGGLLKDTTARGLPRDRR